jgi:hypothetical protein
MKNFNFKPKFIDENAELAQEMLSEISIKVNALKKVVDYSTKNDINLLSTEFDEDIKSTLEELAEMVDFLSDELVFKN